MIALSYTEQEAVDEWNNRPGEQKAYEQGYEDAISKMEKAIIEGCEDGRTPIGILHYENDGEQ